MGFDWEGIINGMDFELPENGSNPPTLEMSKRKIPELVDKGEFSKLTTEVYFFINKEDNKTYTMQKHWLSEYGEVALRDALLVIKKPKV